jgi:hypothetical protein
MRHRIRQGIVPAMLNRDVAMLQRFRADERHTQPRIKCIRCRYIRSCDQAMSPWRHNHAHSADVGRGKSMPIAQRQDTLDSAICRAAGGPRFVTHFANAPAAANSAPNSVWVPAAFEQCKVAVLSFERLARSSHSGGGEIDGPHCTLSIEPDLHRQQRVALNMRLHRATGLSILEPESSSYPLGVKARDNAQSRDGAEAAGGGRTKKTGIPRSRPSQDSRDEVTARDPTLPLGHRQQRRQQRRYRVNDGAFVQAIKFLMCTCVPLTNAAAGAGERCRVPQIVASSPAPRRSVAHVPRPCLRQRNPRCRLPACPVSKSSASMTGAGRRSNRTPTTCAASLSDAVKAGAIITAAAWPVRTGSYCIVAC